MKKNLSRFLAALLLPVCLATAPVSASQSGTLTGESGVTELIISVAVPTNLDFTLDPFEIASEGGSQIVPSNYFFVNQTDAPVKVTLDVTAVLGDGVELVDDPSLLAKDDDTATDKDMFLALLGAESLDAGDLTFDNASKHTAQGVYDPAGDTLIPFDPDTRSASIVFVLAPAEGVYLDSEGGVLAADNTGVGAFQFYGGVNTYADWNPGDIQITATYNITPLRASTYEGYFTDGMFTESGWGTQLRTVESGDLPDLNPEDSDSGSEDSGLGGDGEPSQTLPPGL